MTPGLWYTAERALAYAGEQGIRRYSATPHEDMLLLLWQKEMLEAGEFGKIFHLSCLSASKFYPVFRHPSSMFYALAPAGDRIQTAMWFEPGLFGAWTGVWAADGSRHSPGTLRRLQACYALGFLEHDLLAGITAQVRLLRTHERMGYQIACKLPYLMNGQDTWLLFFSREAYQQSIMNPWKTRVRAATA